MRAEMGIIEELVKRWPIGVIIVPKYERGDTSQVVVYGSREKNMCTNCCAIARGSRARELPEFSQLTTRDTRVRWTEGTHLDRFSYSSCCVGPKLGRLE